MPSRVGDSVAVDIEPGARSVLVVSHTGELGGAERALLRLLAASDPRFVISLVTLADGSFVTEARRDGLRVRVVDGGGVVRVTRRRAGSLRGVLASLGGTLAAARRLRRVLVEENADLIVANSLKAAVLVSLVAGRRRWVWHLHDRLARDYLPAPVMVAMRILARIGPRRIVANSRATAATTGRLPVGRVAVAYPGLETTAFLEPKSMPGDGPVGIVGRIAPTKGQSEFVSAAVAAGLTRPDVRFRIVGAPLFEDAGYADALSEQVAHSDLRDRLEQVGWSESPSEELRGLQVFVHASPVPEPFGQVIVEAMAVGTPVVATDAGGVREILDPGGHATVIADGVRRAPNGLLVRPADVGALATAITWSLEHRAEMAEAARRAHHDVASRFTIERTWAVVSRVWLAALD